MQRLLKAFKHGDVPSDPTCGDWPTGRVTVLVVLAHSEYFILLKVSCPGSARRRQGGGALLGEVGWFLQDSSTQQEAERGTDFCVDKPVVWPGWACRWLQATGTRTEAKWLCRSVTIRTTVVHDSFPHASFHVRAQVHRRPGEACGKTAESGPVQKKKKSPLHMPHFFLVRSQFWTSFVPETGRAARSPASLALMTPTPSSAHAAFTDTGTCSHGFFLAFNSWR